jgi:hypothetical protein
MSANRWSACASTCQQRAEYQIRTSNRNDRRQTLFEPTIKEQDQQALRHDVARRGHKPERKSRGPEKPHSETVSIAKREGHSTIAANPAQTIEQR